VTTQTVVWRGAEGLRDALVPVDDLRPHPRNPRRGVIGAIAQSLQRFGQQRPVLALQDGTLVAGHHVWLAAVQDGWTHVAVVRSDLAEGEVEAYLLADNRLSDLGLYDDALLAELLAPMRDADMLGGIGYSPEDVDALLAYLNPTDLLLAPTDEDPTQRPYALGEADLFRIMLSYDQPTYERVIRDLDRVIEAQHLETYSDAVQWAAAHAAG
jgi:hypothetical protein